MGIVSFYLDVLPILFNSTYLNGQNDVMKDSKGKSSRTPTSTTVFSIEILSLSIMDKATMIGVTGDIGHKLFLAILF